MTKTTSTLIRRLFVVSLATVSYASDTSPQSFNQLVDLLPFDVVLELSENTIPIKSSELRRKTQEWLNLEFEALVRDDIDLDTQEPKHAFDRILLDDAKRQRRHLQEDEEDGGEEDGGDGETEGDEEEEENGEEEQVSEPTEGEEPVPELQESTKAPDSQTTTTTYQATYVGVSIWETMGETDLVQVPGSLAVASYQLNALLSAQDTLLEMLQSVDSSLGLGANVIGVAAQINTEYEEGDSSSNDPGGLNTVIIVAIVIAALAFLLLAFAMFMAWRQSRQRSNAFKVDSPRNTKSTGQTEESGLSPKSGANGNQPGHQSPPPSEIGQSDMGGGLYPDSVISEDISTSLTAYYKSGMAGGGQGVRNAYDEGRLASGGLNDAASVSSMESYGYSLDGYASTIGGGTRDGTFANSK
uniref:Uncharacterized protein n=1 Tax=Grammatophora oceanica TaxID=210454 RepID=A0A7S1YKC4_9STRA|mmetsp:Transcript_51645/g.77064  ORF Transcript_51645/g.77064 Transcript_51645/m.77064 type:complete len:413 (+) Transcript_51645:322-1560(+)|eukprot:CAMPEP_0194070164 /NCGR_PEP_ID=MMETSP0009_2-20130614/88034_1 /TAXON_ID=210454 /ORGANISM="Grammatophora oceanica, Strain CCMP 410" /LENGTH=412 /DNA_ID=CAMNT_0038723417 /DNA_START=665 /DNA_END=1903 /DNA_ORIENTATION=+